jgi:radical SAM protein with 4Fe4S-binding SPASM domain
LRLCLRLRWLRLRLRWRRTVMAVMTNLKSQWVKLVGGLHSPIREDPEPGLYHYRRETGGEKTRVHLRLDPDGQGLLMVNASRVFHLNPTAAFMVYLSLEGLSEKQAESAMRRRYQVSRSQAHADYAQIASQLDQLIRPDGACPICELDLENTAPFSARPSAPYRMDLALTYRCNNACAHCYNARPRSFPQLSTGEWKKILDRLWELGIPHVVFTGGEPTLRDDLAELVAHAEKNGQITGLNTNARRLSNPETLNRLVQAGLDHVQITLESHDPAIHNLMVAGGPKAWPETVAGLRNALKSPLYVMTNTTLLQANSPYLAETLEFLAAEGVPTLGLNALIYSGRGLTVGSGLAESALPPLLEIARQLTTDHGQRLIWYTPTQYCHFDPVLLDLGVKGCTAALYNMCVEPNGDVIPCQSYYQPLGNLVKDPWETIWQHDLAVSLRERKAIPPGCAACLLLPECGGGCPLSRHVQTVHPVQQDSVVI